MRKLLLFCLLANVISHRSQSQVRSEFLDAQMALTEAGSPYSYVREVVLSDAEEWIVLVKYKSGTPQMQGTYSDERLVTEQGFFRYYFANGKPESEGNYDHGVKVGTWKRWDWEGVAKADRIYPDEVPMELRSEMIPAEFAGGDESLTIYIERNLVYPDEAIKTSSSGTVYVAFNISSEGYIGTVETVQGVNFFLDNEAKRLVSEMPRWRPAMKNGIAIDSKFILPIKFELPREAKVTIPDNSGGR